MVLKTKKELGQHWLHDHHSLQSMVEIANVSKGDVVLEIGPGLGTLTAYLLNTGSNVIAVEYDWDLYIELKRKAPKLFPGNQDNLQLFNEDIMKFDLTKLPTDYKVVANIPYYLTSNLIRVLSESANPPISVSLLVQKEVAERIASKPGDMSILSVTTQMYYEPSLGTVVKAELFTPPPKIDSQIIHLQRRAVPLFESLDSKLLFRIVKAGFSNRRKTLLNSLSAGLNLSKENTKSLLDSTGIDPQLRPQALDLDDWIKLARNI